MHRLQPRRAPNVPGAAAVLVVQKHNEIRVFREMVERGFDQFADRLFRRQAFEIELALLLADVLIDPFEHGEVERVLVAEVVIDELLVDAGTALRAPASTRSPSAPASTSSSSITTSATRTRSTSPCSN